MLPHVWMDVQSCPTLCDPMNCNPPGSSVHGIFQARTLQWVAVPSSKGSSQPRDQTSVSCISYVSCIGRQILYHWTTREGHKSFNFCQVYRPQTVSPSSSLKKIINEIEHFLWLAQSVEHETPNLSFMGLSLTLGDVFGFPGGSDGKESACNAGNLDLIPGLRRSPREGNGYPLQYSCLENSMDRGAWGATVHGVTKSQTQLSY